MIQFPGLTRILDRTEDTLRRPTGWHLKNGGTTEHSNAYSYHATDGRLLTVAGSGTSFAYGYTPGTYGLISTVGGPGHTVFNTWLPDRDALDYKENSDDGTIFSKYDYSVNALSQRQSVETYGVAFGGTELTGWGYDRLGQVVTADHTLASGSKDFGYAYDQMGNRTRSSKNGTNPAAATGANLGIYRQGAGGSGEGGTALNQYGVLELYGTTTALTNTYDTDGNQREGRFPTTPSTSTAGGNVRSWDGENRLINATVHGSTPTLYNYDAFHRRVAKRTSASDATMTLYDGWNPIAEYGIPTSSLVLLTSYTWGKDLSGTLQGAGGVGGLLAVQRHSPTTSPGTYYPTYDGNGNVSEYLNSVNAIVAHYEYSPFGELIDGSSFDNVWFKHRFSTKPLDWETGYYYYGYRSYDPLSGRWPNRDPIGERGGMNLYGMVSNKIITSIDFLGREIISTTQNSSQSSESKKYKEYDRFTRDGKCIAVEYSVTAITTTVKNWTTIVEETDGKDVTDTIDNITSILGVAAGAAATNPVTLPKAIPLGIAALVSEAGSLVTKLADAILPNYRVNFHRDNPSTTSTVIDRKIIGELTVCNCPCEHKDCQSDEEN